MLKTSNVQRPSRLSIYARLSRISNLPTVWSNVLAAVVLGNGHLGTTRVAWIALDLSIFYVAGMFLNDAFDRKIDAIQRPERPIPSGWVSAREVFAVGFALLAAALGGLGLGTTLSDGQPSLAALSAGGALACVIVLYNAWHKNNPLSSVIMGSCRACVYATAALASGGSLTRPLLFGALGLLLYVVGLTEVARAETRAPNVRRTVVRLIAGMSLVDAAYLAASDHLLLAVVAVACVPLTLALQRLVRGT